MVRRRRCPRLPQVAERQPRKADQVGLAWTYGFRYVEKRFRASVRRSPEGLLYLKLAPLRPGGPPHDPDAPPASHVAHAVCYVCLHFFGYPIGGVRRTALPQAGRNLLPLALDIHEEILFLPPTAAGRALVTERGAGDALAESSFREQRDVWREIVDAGPWTPRLTSALEGRRRTPYLPRLVRSITS